MLGAVGPSEAFDRDGAIRRVRDGGTSIPWRDAKALAIFDSSDEAVLLANFDSAPSFSRLLLPAGFERQWLKQIPSLTFLLTGVIYPEPV
jgi:hypothetical protein